MALRDDLTTKSWETMKDKERSAWLHLFILGNDVQLLDGHYMLNDGTEITTKPGPNLISLCESSLSDSGMADKYIKFCLKEVSNITYLGMTKEQIALESTSKIFYKNAIMLSPEHRGRSMFWTIKAPDQ